MKKKYAIFTMDVEEFADTGCVHDKGTAVDASMLDGLDEYMNILERHGIRATLFVVYNTVKELKDRIRSYVSRGHSVGLHGYDHTPPVQLDTDAFRRNVRYAKEQMEQELGVSIRGFRAPFFGLDNEKLQVLMEEGFSYDSSSLGLEMAINSGHIDLKRFRRLGEHVFCKNGFFEFGIPKQKWMNFTMPVGGGGYVRLGYWPFVKNLLESYLTQNNYYVFYLHPFELSKEKVPHIPNLRGYERLYLSRGLRNFEYKIEIIIRMLKRLGYEFVTFEEYADLMSREAG